MRFLRILPLLAAALLGVATRPAAAQRITSPYEYIDPSQSLAVTAGYLDTSRGSVGLGPKPAAFAGVRWAIRLNGPFVIQADLDYFKSTRSVLDTAFVSQTDTSYVNRGDADQNLILALGAVRFDLTGARTWHRLQPYVLFGGGVVISTTGTNGADAAVVPDARFRFGTSFAGQFGGGIEWYLTRRLALYGDVRGVLWKLKTPQAFLLTQKYPASEWTQNASVGAGLAFHF